MEQHFRRAERTTLSQKSQNRRRKEEEEIFEFNPQSKYARLYEKYTSEASDAFTFDYQDKKRASFCDIAELDRANARIRELSVENAGLKEELKERKDQIERLKYELYYCNSQLQQINKIQGYQYQQAINQLRKEIQIMMEKNKETEDELARLKLSQADHSKSYGLKMQIYKPQKENQAPKITLQQTRQIQTNKLFILGLIDMHAKIVGSSARSLKQLWKWLKDLGQLSSRLRKWRRKYRQFLKTCLSVNLQQLMPFLDEAMIIIN